MNMEEYKLEDIEKLDSNQQEIIFKKMLDEQMNSLDLSKLNLNVASKIIEKEKDTIIKNGEIVNNEKVSYDEDFDDENDERYNQKFLEYERKIAELKKQKVDSNKVTDNEINEAFKNFSLDKLKNVEFKEDELITLDKMSYEEILNSKLPSFIKEELLNKRKNEKPIETKKNISTPLYEKIEKEKNSINYDEINKIINNNNKKVMSVIVKIIKENNKKMEDKFRSMIDDMLIKIIKNK